MLSKDVMDLLRCPKCMGQLREVGEPQGLNCPTCHLLYPIRDGIPNLLIEEALAETAEGARRAWP